MTGTISTTLTSSYALQAQSTTITNSGAVIMGSGTAVVGAYVGATYGWTVANSGMIRAPDQTSPVPTRGTGIDLRGIGDHLENTASGVIGGDVGVYVAHAGANIVNFGAIGLTTFRTGYFYADSAVGVILGNGGAVTNAANGVITAYSGVIAEHGRTTVTNVGSIFGFNGVGVDLRAGGVVINQANARIDGLRVDDQEYGVYIRGGTGTVVNAGTISGFFAAVSLPAGYDNRVVAEPGAVFGGLVTGGNTIGAAQVSTLPFSSGDGGLGRQFIDFVQVTIDADAFWTTYGPNTIVAGATLTELQGASLTVGDTLSTDGTLQIDGTMLMDGSMLVATVLAGTGSLILGSGSVLEADTVDVQTTVTLRGADTTVRIDDTDAFRGTISGFATGDSIDLSNFSGWEDAAAIVSGDLLEVSGLESTADIPISGLPDGRSYFVARDAGIGIDIVACFAAGTRIATPTGEIPVEKLAIGDMVATVSGAARPVKWIGRRNHSAPFVASNPQLRPVRIRAGALGRGLPLRDLLVSPCHAMLVDALLIPAASLVDGVSVTREPPGEASYLHIELHQPDLVFAEGAAAETFVDCDNRMMFQNVAEYFSLYPGEVRAPPAFPASRIEEGFVLETVRARLAKRAGRLLAGGDRGPLCGHVECITATAEGVVVEGWAVDAVTPDISVELEIVASGQPPARLLANRYRIDLDRAGIADGRGGFRHVLPSGTRGIAVRRVGDLAPLLQQEGAMAG